MTSSYRTPHREEVSAGLVRHLLRYDAKTGIFRWKNPMSNRVRKGAIAGWLKKGRRIITIDNKRFPASHVAWLYVYGEWPKMEVDHRNRDKLDNSIANLRDVTGAVNCQNQGKNKTNTS